MYRKLRYISKCNKLVQLVVQVKYHVNVIYNLGGGHTHTDIADKCNFKKPGTLAGAPGLKSWPSSSLDMQSQFLHIFYFAELHKCM